MATLTAKIRKYTGGVNRVFDHTFNNVSGPDEVHTIVDHWNENEDQFWYEIISIEEGKI